MPFLAVGYDGVIYASWIDPLSTGGHALRFARWSGATWTAPETIASGNKWFVNWSDFPALSVLPDGSMLAHWLTRAPEGGTHGYGIRVAKRSVETKTWREIHGMSLDEKEDYAGFLSFVPHSAGAIYLAPPAGAKPAVASHDGHGGEHRKTIRFVAFHPDGSLDRDEELDYDVCSCCPTAVAATSNGLLAAYRDHLPGEIRDISVVRRVDGKWTKPKTLHPDGWKINGCPTDGPTIASSGKNTAIAWLTRAADVPKVQVSLSRDAGVSFRAPVRVDDGNPLGRPSITMLDPNNYLLVWLEKTDEGKADIRMRRIGVDGAKGESRVVAPAAAARSTGFPKVAVSGDQIIVAWRDDRVRAVLLSK